MKDSESVSPNATGTKKFSWSFAFEVHLKVNANQYENGQEMMLAVRFVQKLEIGCGFFGRNVFLLPLIQFFEEIFPEILQFFHGSDVVQLQDFRCYSTILNLRRIFFDYING